MMREYSACTPPRLGRYWEIHSLRPRDFPQTFVLTGNLLGLAKSLTCWCWSPSCWWSTGIESIYFRSNAAFHSFWSPTNQHSSKWLIFTGRRWPRGSTLSFFNISERWNLQSLHRHRHPLQQCRHQFSSFDSGQAQTNLN